MYLDLTKIILKWYYDNKRILPWRKNNRKKLDPYKVWISEIMLQQTSVNTVVKRYEKFLIKFPNIFELSDSNLNRVLEEWAGLGYYSRARNLHASARILVKKYKGIFPEDEKKLLTLPGIGLYTSGAIRALAFNKYDIAVDVNAERVVSRIFTIKKTINYKNLIRKKTFLMVPKNKSGDLNCTFPIIISNHDKLEYISEQFNIKYAKIDDNKKLLSILKIYFVKLIAFVENIIDFAG